MKLLKKPAVAIIISIALVIGSTLLSGSAKLKKDIQQVTDGFYTGVTYDGYSHPSIYSQLTNITGAVDGMCAIAENNGYDANELSNASHYLKSSLSTMHDYISSIHWSYSELCDALTAFKLQINSMELNERDSDGMNKYLETIANAQRMIENAGYNESVRNYKNNMGAIANFIADICDINEPEYFT